MHFSTHYKNILVVLLLLHTTLYANHFAFIFVDDIVVPVPIKDQNTTISDTTSPNKPTLTIAPQATTYENEVSIEIQGEVGSTILVNGYSAGIIDSSGKKIISLNTSGENGIKTFTLTLKDKSNNISDSLSISITKIDNPNFDIQYKKIDNSKFDIKYKGLTLYQKNMPESNYQLSQLSDSTFNQLNSTQKLQVANTLLSTLFFGYPQQQLLEKIDSGQFISNVLQGLKEEKTDKAILEERLLNNHIFKQFGKWAQPQVLTILTRFYAMHELDSYFLKNWIAYILTQTIMFSPAYELESVHNANIANVYNRIVTFQNEESSMRYITYVHMMSEDNWRRFRSPEDNGREMLEIFHFDTKDSHVPLAGKALKNWKINIDGDTLEVGLNDNTEPINLFGTIIKNGDDFYRELVKSSLFIDGATKRLVAFFFPNKSEQERAQITTKITSSHPETWQDILLQIVFSEEYLLHNKRAKSIEELFFSLTKKMNFKHNVYTFLRLKNALEHAHQASMKYKLGKTTRVPLDSFSFAYSHKYLREDILMRKSHSNYINDYTSWQRHGWDDSFIDTKNFILNENDIMTSLNAIINYIFKTIIYREANTQELAFFKNVMTYNKNGKTAFYWAFNIFIQFDDEEKTKKERTRKRKYLTMMVLDYLSRLDTLYLQKKVK